ncbi:MAG: 5-(carboxyamino)imidazole ribonucleotide synthase [Gammaproteobacteria bacterium]|jgi:5-(carboxyamino)imidazole ribonucleotide synthase
MKIGIIGAGQLGRMLALAGYPLGLRFVFVDQSAEAPGGQVGEIITGAFDDPAALAALADRVDVVTFDVENVPESAVRGIAGTRPFLPPVEALATAQDRLSEKRVFTSLGIPTPRFAAVSSRDELDEAIELIGLPAVLKTRRLGYDGRGQAFLRREDDVAPAWERFGDYPLILEQLVEFDREVSLIGVRRPGGETRCYPLAENVHVDGILSHTRAPLAAPALQTTAERYIGRLMQHLDYAGVLTVEFFVEGDRLLANEMAPRVHNSGHWTIEGAVCSQFENHVRAILDLPLGETRAVGHAGMVNLLGELPALEDVLAIPGAHFHGYGKTPRPMRKLGHCTVVRDDPAERDHGLRGLLALAGRDQD